MEKEFIYLFKHTGFSPIKIGRTSGLSVTARFNQFKTYAPHGAEIVGFFECDDCVKTEKELHKKYSKYRMRGEWFDISLDTASEILNNTKSVFNDCKSIFMDWVSNPDNNVDELIKIMTEANLKPIRTYLKTKQEVLLAEKYVKPGSVFMTGNDIKNFILSKEPAVTININKLCSTIKKMGAVRTSKSGRYGYLIELQ